jgi:flavodoxin
MIIAVRYLSKTGHTKQVAEVIAQELGVMASSLQSMPSIQLLKTYGVQQLLPKRLSKFKKWRVYVNIFNRL